MDEVLRRARQLGESIVADGCYRRHQEAQRRAAADPEAQRLLGVYRSFQRRWRQQEKDGRVASPREIEERERLECRVRENEVLWDLLRSQADLAEMLSRVQQTLEEVMQKPPGYGPPPD